MYVSQFFALLRGCRVHFDVRHEFLQHRFRVSDHWDIHPHVFVDFSGIQLDVDLLSVLRVVLEVARDAIVKAHAHSDDQIGFLDGLVHPRLTVHPHHAEVVLMRCGEPTQAEQRACDRNVGFLNEIQKHTGGFGFDDTVARKR